jgi:hypothetical protein
MYEELYTPEVEKAIDININKFRRTTKISIDRDELIGTAHETFMECAEKYDPSKKVAFHTFYSSELFWDFYDVIYRHAGKGKSIGKRKNNEYFYGKILQKGEMELYNEIFENTNSIRNEKQANEDTFFCGRVAIAWKESENKLIDDIAFQSMSNDAKTIVQAVTESFDLIMEKYFRTRAHMTRAKAKRHAIYDYFQDQGWSEHRIMSAFREIKENLKR